MRGKNADIAPRAAQGPGNGPGDGRDEERCRIAASLVERAARDEDLMLAPPGREWFARALEVGAAPPAGRARRRILLPVLAGAALAGLVLLVARGRALRYEVQGSGVASAGGRVETAAGQRATLRFSDGTSIALGERSAGRVTGRTGDGATFAVERGRASFDVVHRAHARWSVFAGPFEILVTGTRFDVEWAGERGRALAVDLRAGAVVVRGGSAGAGVPLRAGQRLVADAAGGALSVTESASSERPATAPPPPPPTPAPTNAAEPAPVGGDDERSGSGDHGSDDRAARAERARAGRAATGASAGTAAAVAPQVVVAPSPAERARLEPGPWPAPPFLPESKLAAGGADCLGWAPQMRFDQSIDGASVAPVSSLAFSRPALDRGRSWCGAGSLRVDAKFDLTGTPDRLGNRPHHVGEVVIKLATPLDLTLRTLIAHFYVEAASDVRFGAQVFAVTGDEKWVGGGFAQNLAPGRWMTISHTYGRENRIFVGGTSAVTDVRRLTLQIYATGKERIWTGRVFVDDFGWQ